MTSLKKRGKYYYGRWQKTEDGESFDVKKSLKVKNKWHAENLMDTLDELEEHGEINPYHPSFDPVQALEEAKKENQKLNIYSVREAADYFYEKKKWLSNASINNDTLNKSPNEKINEGGTYERVIEYFIKINGISGQFNIQNIRDTL